MEKLRVPTAERGTFETNVDQGEATVSASHPIDSKGAEACVAHIERERKNGRGMRHKNIFRRRQAAQQQQKPTGGAVGKISSKIRPLVVITIDQSSEFRLEEFAAPLCAMRQELKLSKGSVLALQA